MQHRLSVTGSMPRERIPVIGGIEVEEAPEGVVFIAPGAEEMKKLKRILSFSIADMITEEYEDKRLRDVIFARNPCLTAAEREEILSFASRTMRKMPPGKRRKLIEEKLYAFLEESTVLSIEGFLNFRLKEYKKQICETAEEAASVFMAEREYEEFIALLRYFVYMQPQRMEVLHVCILEGGTFCLYDGDGKDVTESLIEEVFMECTGLSGEDVLISLLITFAPGTIFLHHARRLGNPRLAETVVKVFGKSVEFCDECPLCKKTE